MNDLHVVGRALEGAVEQALAAFPVVILTGARQTGKTTLVRHLPSASGRPFRTLDDLRVLEQAERDPDLLVSEAERMTLDEVQRVPNLLLAVKRAVDERRRPGRFLLTGSANLLLMQNVSESLAGRAVYLHLGPLTQSEKEERSGDGIWTELLRANDLEEAMQAAKAARSARGHWTSWALEGGYPPILSLRAEDRARWFEGYITTYLERDLQQLANISSLSDFRRLLEIAALRLGGLLNVADLARDAGLARPTAHRYLGLLEVSFQARLLRPYSVSRTKRLVKSPKLYWGDTGLAAHLAGVERAEDFSVTTRSGAFLENVLLCHLDTWRETLVPRPEVFYWRTAAGAEVDLVIEHRRRLLPIEVRASGAVRRADADKLEDFLDQYSAAKIGVVAYTGDEVHPVTKRVIAVPVGLLV